MRRKSLCAGWAARQRWGSGKGAWGVWLESAGSCSLGPILKWHMPRKNVFNKDLIETEVGGGFSLLSVMCYGHFQLSFPKKHYNLFLPYMLFNLDLPSL